MPGPTSIRVTTFRSSVAENSATSASTPYAQLTLLGPVGLNNILTLSGDDASLFQITALSSRVYTLSLKTGVSLDFETNPLLNVTIAARDALASPASAVSTSFAVQVTDVAELPPATRISAIQGAGADSPLVNQVVTVEGRVTAWLPNAKMFFVQEELADQDGNASTSEGIAVFYGNNPSPVDANSIGDVVRFDSTVSEYFGLTELTNVTGFSVIQNGSAASLDAATQVTLPVANAATLEQFEGMLVNVSAASGGALYAGDTFTYARYGEITFYADEVPTQYTQGHTPSVIGNAAYLDFLARNSIQLEDGNTAQNPSLSALEAGSMIDRGGADFGPENFVRVGDSTMGITGVLSYGFGVYELQPTSTVTLTPAPRAAAPDAAQINANGVAEIKVASFNVLNYFTSLDVAGITADNFTNPYGITHEPRGANTTVEFVRQQAKIVEAIIGSGADVLALNEMQNNGFVNGTSAIDSLVDALNAKVGADVYGYVSAPFKDGDGVDEPTAGTDAIMVAMIFNKTKVQTLGQAATPDIDIYTAFADSSRPPLAQTFAYVDDSSKQFTLVANHFKSKGSVSTNFSGDADTGDGQGNNNPTRVEAAADLARWIATNPTGATDGDYLLVGDFNSYASEDPIRFLTDASFDETANFGGYDIPVAAEALSGTYQYLGSADDYSYVFDGLRGSLDHAIASTGIGGEVTGITHWHINADEQIAMDYNTEFNPADLYSINPFRASDHDPVVIGLKLNSEAGSPVQPPADTTAPVLASSNPADNAVSVTVGSNIVLTFNESVQKGTGTITLKGLDGATDVVLDVASAAVSVSGTTVTLNPAADLAAGKQYALQVGAGVLTDLAGNAFGGIADTASLNFTTAAPVAAPVVFISEIHYDNTGTDAGEAIGISGTAGTDLTGWSLVLYNGNPTQRTSYNTKSLGGTFIDNEGGGFGEVFFSYPSNGIQNGGTGANGEPDGIALVNNLGAVVQFLSYEGSFVASGGPASGMTSTNIGAFEAGTGLSTGSIQLIGSAWVTDANTNSFGTLNTDFLFA